MIGYSDVVERQMVKLYDSLREKDRRRYAAVEAVKLGHGGVEYIAALFDCDPHTIRHGEQDIEQLPTDEAAGRVRKGGRRKASVAQAGLLPAVEQLIAQDTAGSPVDADLRWTNRSPAADRRLATPRLRDRRGCVAENPVPRVGSVCCQAFKDEAACYFPHRDCCSFSTSPSCGLSMSDRIGRC